MQIKSYKEGGLTIAHIVADNIIIKNIEDAILLMGDLYYQGFDKMVIYEHNLTADFFDLSSRLAGEILQKFSTYGMKLDIIGNFAKYNSRNLDAFIRESNRGQLIRFIEQPS